MPDKGKCKPDLPVKFHGWYDILSVGTKLYKKTYG